MSRWQTQADGIAQFISDQLTARPQGAHCENTKIWPFCMSAAGLGLKLYDSLLHTSLNEPFLDWIAFAKKRYMGRDRRGRTNLPVARSDCAVKSVPAAAERSRII